MDIGSDGRLKRRLFIEVLFEGTKYDFGLGIWCCGKRWVSKVDQVSIWG